MVETIQTKPDWLHVIFVTDFLLPSKFSNKSATASANQDNEPN